jgi:hypothetical protein
MIIKVEDIIAGMTGIGAGMIGGTFAKSFRPTSGNKIVNACLALGSLSIADMVAQKASDNAYHNIKLIKQALGKEEVIDVGTKHAEVVEDSNGSAEEA